MQNKSNKNTQNKNKPKTTVKSKIRSAVSNETPSFEAIFLDSLRELFHHESEKRIFSFNDLNLIDTKYIADFLNTPIFEINELIDTKELSELIDWKQLKLFNKKDFDLLNWKQVSFFTQYVGAFCLLLSVSLGMLGVAMRPQFQPLNDEFAFAPIRTKTIYIDSGVNRYPENPVTFLSYVNGQQDSSESFNEVLGSSTYACSFISPDFDVYSDRSTLNMSRSIKYSGATTICADQMAGGASYSWVLLTENSEAYASSSCVDLDAENILDGSDNIQVFLEVFDSAGMVESTCGLNVNYFSETR